jgi:hypothetical protein
MTSERTWMGVRVTFTRGGVTLEGDVDQSIDEAADRPKTIGRSGVAQ